MKKLFLFTLIICMLASSLTAFAYGVTIDGISCDCDMLFQSGTVYLSVEEVSAALGKSTNWDEKTQTVFVNGIYLFPKKGEKITVYVDGEKKIEGEGIIMDGKTYLPAHIVAAALGYTASWDDATGTVSLTGTTAENGNASVEEGKSYAIINKSTGYALTVSDGGLTTAKYTAAESQEFKFIKTEFDGYYHIRSVSSGKNLDVNGHGTTAGVSIILWDQGTEDNQKFAVEAVPGGVIIYSRNRNLPIEPSGSGIIQNTKTLSINQKWEIIEFGKEYVKKDVSAGAPLVVTTIPEKPVKEEPKVINYVFSSGNLTLTDTNGLNVTESESISQSEMWTLNEVSEGVYIITNAATGKSIDVNARSLEEGGSIITYSTNSDANQRWILEAEGDGTYLIKSVHSSLYLTISSDNTLIQASKNTSLSQKWTVTPLN